MDIENEIWGIMSRYLKVEPMERRREDWIQMDKKIEFMPVDYAYYFVQYQNLYFSEVYNEYKNISVVIYGSGLENAVGIWPLCIYRNNQGELQLGSIGGLLLEPLLIDDVEETDLSIEIRQGGGKIFKSYM